jgi:hypothetical protein
VRGCENLTVESELGLDRLVGRAFGLDRLVEGHPDRGDLGVAAPLRRKEGRFGLDHAADLEQLAEKRFGPHCDVPPFAA